MAVLDGRFVSNLPGSVHLISKTPKLDIPRIGAPIRLAQIRPIAAAGVIDVFNKITRRIQIPRSKIHRQHHFRTGGFGPVGKFVDANMIAF